MIFRIEIESNKIDDMETLCKNVGNPIHESLAGNQDYIDSNIVLNIDKVNNNPECTLAIAVDDCNDKEYVKEKVRNAIDVFLNNL